MKSSATIALLFFDPTDSTAILQSPSPQTSFRYHFGNAEETAPRYHAINNVIDRTENHFAQSKRRAIVKSALLAVANRHPERADVAFDEHFVANQGAEIMAVSPSVRRSSILGWIESRRGVVGAWFGYWVLPHLSDGDEQVDGARPFGMLRTSPRVNPGTIEQRPLKRAIYGSYFPLLTILYNVVTL